MKFANEISVDAPPDDLFEFLADVERVAPCLPGASIDGKDGDDYQGSMKVKVGPITGRYRGTMRFLELDRDRRRAVMQARAEEESGQGNAEARIDAAIEEADGKSRLRMQTDLQMRGRVAQFGRGAMERISQRMFSEFAHNIEQQIADGALPPEDEQQIEGREGAGGRADVKDRPSKQKHGPGDADEGAALDAFGLVGGPLIRKAGPVLVPALVGFGYGYLVGRLRELTR